MSHRHLTQTSLVEKLEAMDYGTAPEDPTLLLAWLDGFQRRFGHFIAGSWVAPAQSEYFETSDP